MWCQQRGGFGLQPWNGSNLLYVSTLGVLRLGLARCYVSGLAVKLSMAGAIQQNVEKERICVVL